MFKTHSVLLACIILTFASGLHLLDSTQAQIDALKAQQGLFEASINNLIINISNVEKSMNVTTDVNQKVLILEKAIVSERQSVYELSKVIIPPFNISKEGCQKMTDAQKLNLLDSLDKARKQVYQLQNISSTLPKCDEVDAIKRDIEKQIFFLNSIESIIYTNCTMNVILSPTIFQTNIYAPNWILGNMTIDDLIEQYYQRSIRYDNITNCPIEFPFFDGKACIQCPADKPAFDISQKMCVPCPPDYGIDNSQKKCVLTPHYTNWASVNNYAPNTTFPAPQQGATPCPSNQPFFNGTGCVSCQLPSYFNTSTNKCDACPVGFSFDTNIFACVNGTIKHLTLLSGTRWVTGTNNFTNVLKERIQILQANKTSGVYRDCPSSSPYNDGMTCISCPQEFDMNTLKCVSAATGVQYDDNIHSYIPPTTGETAPTAPNLLGTPPADNPNVQNCGAAAPYWDGVACIMCPQPYLLFDLSTKKCVVCGAESFYNSATRSCLARPIIYISSNELGLLETSNRTISQYHDNITATIQANPNAILMNCPTGTQYSNFTTCFNCSKNESFNVETMKCQFIPPIPSYPNLTAGAWISSNASKVIEWRNNLQKVSDSQVCPVDKPYYNNQVCLSCQVGQFFNYDTFTCGTCPSGQVFNPNNLTCVAPSTIAYQTNPDSANLIYGSKPYNQLVDEFKQNQTKGVQECLAPTPYKWASGCTNCLDNTYYFNLDYQVCMHCPAGSTYVATQKNCVQNSSNDAIKIGPDIAKMYANIF